MSFLRLITNCELSEILVGLTYLLTARYASWHIGQQQTSSTRRDYPPTASPDPKAILADFIPASRVLLHVVFGLPLRRLPSGVQ